MEEIKILELFSGYGGASWALKRANIPHKCVGYSDIEKSANYIFALNHGKDIKELGDCRKIDPNDLEDFDLLTAGFPCAPAGTLIITKKGYKKVEDIELDDEVLTHKNRWKKVIELMSKKSNHINIIKALGCNLKLTDEHPVYTYEDNKFVWKDVKDLKKGDYVSYNINKQSKNPNKITKNEAWLLGRYAADGSFQKDERNRLYFCIGKKKREEFAKYIKDYQHFICHEDRNCQEIFVKDFKLQKFCKMIGVGSTNKEIPQWIIDLPKDILQSFFDGYISGDGHWDCDNTRVQFSTVSEKMHLGLNQIVIKLYERVPTVTKRVDNRKETFNDSYTSQLRLRKQRKQRDSFVVEDKIFGKIKSIERIEKSIKVYNFGVKDDESYCCQNVVTHNCQSFAIQGKRQGFKSKKTGALFFEIIRIAEAKMKRVDLNGLLQPYEKATFLSNISILSIDGNCLSDKISKPEIIYRMHFPNFEEEEEWSQTTYQDRRKSFDKSIQEIWDRKCQMDNFVQKFIDADSIEERDRISKEIEDSLSEWIQYNDWDINCRGDQTEDRKKEFWKKAFKINERIDFNNKKEVLSKSEESRESIKDNERGQQQTRKEEDIIRETIDSSQEDVEAKISRNEKMERESKQESSEKEHTVDNGCNITDEKGENQGIKCRNTKENWLVLADCEGKIIIIGEKEQLNIRNGCRWILLENVEGIISHDDGATMRRVLDELALIGYYVQWKKLYSKDYGTPQNRPRIWFACFRDEEDYLKFAFPEPIPLTTFVKDILEKEVPEKYFLSEKYVKEFYENIDKRVDEGKLNAALMAIYRDDTGALPSNPNSSRTILASHNSDKGMLSRMPMPLVNQRLVAPTITRELAHSHGFNFNAETFRQITGKWRRLMPRESFRLMGFLEDEIDFGDLSDNKLYSLAGNGWEINVATKILKQMIIGNDNKQRGVFDY
jgi:DNA-cytosine methyltransferase